MSGIDSAPPLRPSGLHPTLRGGRYVLARRLAEGGTASVHLGWDSEARQYRAIKTLLPEYAKRAALRHRFENEGRTMQALVHPNIVTVFDAGQERESAWMVLELCEGGSVIDWVERNGRMPPRLACRVALDVCAGMAFAHGRGIIHRDIKPQNVLVARDGTCKITDFGIAQITEENRVTMTGTVMGTIGYMAPEQHESAKHADARADIYSLAATLYTLLVGEAPTHLFMADDRDFAAIPAPLAEVVRKASQYRRELRFDTMEALGDALRAAMEKLPHDPAVPPLVRPEGMGLEGLDPPTAGSIDTIPMVPAVVPSDPPTAAPLPPVLADAKSEDAQTPSLGRITLADDPRRLTAEAREAIARRRRIAGLSAAVFAACVMLVLLIGVVGSVRVNGFVALRDHADQELSAQLHDDRVILDALEPLGLPEQGTVRELWEASETGDREDRMAAANRLLSALDQTRRDLETRGRSDEAHLVKQVRETVRRLQGRLVEVRQREARLEEVRASPSGRLATAFGL